MIVGLLVIGASLAGYYYLRLPATQAGQEKIFIVERGAATWQIAKKLKAENFIDHELPFIVATWLRGARNSLKAGEYLLKPGTTYWELVELINQGKSQSYPVAIPEGFNLVSIINRLVENGVAKPEEALELAYDKDFIKSLGLDAKSLEGYLYPDTYNLSYTQDTKAVLSMMVNRFKSVWDSLPLSNIKLSQHQIVTLASIIEKEARLDSERPIISAVYHNRLKTGMLLQADPTVVYGVDNYKGAITRKHLNTDHAYNTYLNFGLPPGPICSPGKASLAAALNPTNVNYLYFVATGWSDGSHFFAQTYTEHLRNVTKYRQNRRSAKAR